MAELSYDAAGVNIDEATAGLASAKPLIRSTHTANVLSELGSFGGLFAASFPGYEDPVLVASIDGVGTKTLLAETPSHFQGLGRDLVNHCVNDILCQGARPLFFLDYFGTGRLRGVELQSVIAGVAEACSAVGCALIGGETAEMPDVYAPGRFELAGTVVGVVERSRVLPRSEIRGGDVLIGLASDGLHTNGFSLARRVFAQDLDSLREELLAPHRCYFSSLFPVPDEILAIAHITGGGLVDNIPRVLPEGTYVSIDRSSWKEPEIFVQIRSRGVPDSEMLQVFNLGVGMVLIVRQGTEKLAVERLGSVGETAWIMGRVLEGNREVRFE